MRAVAGEMEGVLQSLPVEGCGPEGGNFYSGQESLEHVREQDAAKRKP